MVFDSQKAQQLVIEGCSQHAGEDNSSCSQRRNTADCFGNINGDWRRNGFGNERKQNLLAGTHGLAAEVNDYDSRKRCQRNAAGDSTGLGHDKFTVLVQGQGQSDGCRS